MDQIPPQPSMPCDLHQFANVINKSEAEGEEWERMRWRRWEVVRREEYPSFGISQLVMNLYLFFLFPIRFYKHQSQNNSTSVPTFPPLHLSTSPPLSLPSHFSTVLVKLALPASSRAPNPENSDNVNGLGGCI